MLLSWFCLVVMLQKKSLLVKTIDSNVVSVAVMNQLNIVIIQNLFVPAGVLYWNVH